MCKVIKRNPNPNDFNKCNLNGVCKGNPDTSSIAFVLGILVEISGMQRVKC